MPVALTNGAAARRLRGPDCIQQHLVAAWALAGSRLLWLAGGGVR